MLIDPYLERNEAQRIIKSPEECIKLLGAFAGLEDEDKYGPGTGRGIAHLFRGHKYASYPLLTTLDRVAGTRKRQAENYLLQEFRRRIHQYLPSQSIPQSDLTTLALMQHYGVPTRLLDVTRSPYVALYFAIRDVLEKEDAAVWVINTLNIRNTSLRRIFQKDALLAKQIGKFYDPRAEFTRQELFAKWLMPNESYLDSLNPEYLPYQEIIFDIEPFTMNHRQVVQQGLFLVSASPFKTFEETLVDLLLEIESKMPGGGSHDISIFKIVIPWKLRIPLMRHLEKMNITAASLFEGLEGFADSLREKLTTMDNNDFLGNLLGIPT